MAFSSSAVYGRERERRRIVHEFERENHRLKVVNANVVVHIVLYCNGRDSAGKLYTRRYAIDKYITPHNIASSEEVSIHPHDDTLSLTIV